MSGKYFVSASEDEGARWPFGIDQIRDLAAELHPGAEVLGPFSSGAYQIMLPAQDGREHEVTYHADNPVFVFAEEDHIIVTAGFVLRLLQRLAPDTPAVWMADFDGDVAPLRVAGLSADDFVREIWGEPVYPGA
jgi:hypothetical protein